MGNPTHTDTTSSRRIVRVFDTTLRDGEQSPGVNLNLDEKVQIAKQLERLGVGAMEAGFPITSDGDFACVQAVSAAVSAPIVTGLARAVERDIVRCWDAVKGAKKPMIHTFIATSPIHMEHKLRKSPDDVLRMAIDAVTLAKSLSPMVEFSAEDATRSDWGFLVEVFTAAIEAGADVVNVPDTVGYTLPDEFVRLIGYLKANVRNIDQAIISCHCHNDLGLAVANTVAAAVAGAGQVEVTVNGIGERAGNAALEEVVMALRTRGDISGCDTAIVSEHLSRTSRLVSGLTGMAVAGNKAVVGENAFAHESGIHVDGFLKERTTYEIMTPESVGLSSSRLVLGKHSGRHAFRARCEELNYTLTESETDRCYALFTQLTDKKKEVTDRDIEAIVESHLGAVEEYFHLDYMHISSGISTIPTATVRLSSGGDLTEEAAVGDGPVDAVYKAIDRITGLGLALDEYQIKAVTGGKDALGEVMVRVKGGTRYFVGRGNSTDIIEASARAYIHAANKFMADRKVRGTNAKDPK
jgi:2-isopropylmalate synthase